MNSIEIRKGIPSDIPAVMKLIRELAIFEKAEDQLETTEEQLVQDAFGDKSLFEFFVASSQGQVIGLSLFYYRYSTWKGKGLYLEDLIVTKPYRGQGVGKKLLLETVAYAKQEDCTGMYWQVLDWNSPAIEFYKSLGSQVDGEWLNCKLDKVALSQLG